MEPKQERAKRTRQALIEAARKVFTEKGYPRTTVAEIVKEAGRAHGTFYLYFDNKEHIFEVLLEEVIESLKAQSGAMWRRDNPTQSVYVTVRRFLEEFRRSKEMWLLLDQMAAVDSGFYELRERWRRTFVGKIRRGVETSATEAIAELDTEILAEILAAMVDEICRVSYLEGYDWNPELLARHITTVWTQGLGYPQEHLERLDPGPTQEEQKAS